MEQGFEVKIWGTRGSLAAPFMDRMKYGGNTSCISVAWEEGMAVFDCGTGIRALGEELLNIPPSGKKELHIFISHLHLDHIAGLMFMPQLYQKDWTIHLYGTAHGTDSFQESLSKIASPPYWPVSLASAGANIEWHEIMDQEIIELPGNVTVQTLIAEHPDETLIFGIERKSVRIVYGLDYELTEKSEKRFHEFVSGSSLLIFDGMYTDEELEHHRGFGHSSWSQGTDVAKTCSVKQVCISHHDWRRTDRELERLEQEAKAQNPNCFFACEGMTILLK